MVMSTIPLLRLVALEQSRDVGDLSWREQKLVWDESKNKNDLSEVTAPSIETLIIIPICSFKIESCKFIL
jgi:hypothetical protein